MADDERIAYLSGDTSARLDPAERAELDELRGLLTDPAVWAEPHPGLAERVVGAVTQAASAEPVPTALPVDGDSNRRRRPRWIAIAVGGVAAAVLLAVALTFGLTSHPSQSVEYAASINGTKLAPDASGQVTLTKTPSGWKIQLHAKGLPRRDGGAYYEAWLKNSAGVLVPVGTFNQLDDVTLWAGVAPSSYPTLTVTRQLVDDGPTSSGKVVLIGVTHRTH
ncbi:MAG: hypothetical protein QOG07_2638 [Pseudonocardiales bacterium]|jgi:hypothetical protein|nr:hypothetical protein [Pseudonocardiales bacterium]